MTNSYSDEDGSTRPNTVTMNTTGSTQLQEFKTRIKEMPAVVMSDTIPSLDAQRLKSGPSTPHQQSQKTMGHQISPPTGQPTREGSPRSMNSDSSHTTPAPRRPIRGCRFEAGMAKARRRVPYSLGPEKLETAPEELKRKLGSQEESKLSTDIKSLYSSLVPDPESVKRRTLFVQKLESLLQQRWPGQQINVSVFGSTGNCLGTSDSDVDICITTDCKELEHVCSIAELLDKNGMERIVCVSSAKVPIVKVWDPELQVACDMNVNNPIALENTQMIRSYTAIDERFRPLAIIIKYWAKKRGLNDAALGGTLSSYTWICMVLSFLQTRDPPILPSLQQKPDLAPKILNGVNVAYDRSQEDYKHFGSRNKSSLGQLLFQFFRYYGHELDYEGNAISVRLGKVIPKSQKAWHLLQDNRLCVEEPFNTSRNLANTADDTSMRGIHLELRRAFKLVTEGNLDICCEQHKAAPEERKHTEAFIHPTARTIIPQAPTQQVTQPQRGNRNNFRNTRNNHRSSGRRASNPAGRNSNYLHDLPFQMTPQELQLQAQHQQHLLHDQLFQQYQYLQLQEQELRMQLYQQNLRQRGLPPGQAATQGTYNSSNNSDINSTMPGNIPLRMTMSPTMFQNRYNATSPFLRSSTPTSGVMTNPASPLLSNALPDTRRYTRRTSVTNQSSAGSLRAHSQPARTIPFSGIFNHGRAVNATNSEHPDMPTDRRISFPYQPQMFAPGHVSQPASVSGSLYEIGRRPAEYMGYYVGHSPSLLAHTRSTTISPIPSHAGLAINNGGLSPRVSSRSSRLPSVTSSPSLSNLNLMDTSDHKALSEVANEYHTAPEQQEAPVTRSGPLIVDGSLYSPQRRRPTIKMSSGRFDSSALSASTSDDLGIDTPSSSDDQYQEYRRTSLAKRRNQNGLSQVPNGVSTYAQNSSTGHQNSRGIDQNLSAIDEIQQALHIGGGLRSPVVADNDDSKLNGIVNRRKKAKPGMASPVDLENSLETSTPLGPRTNGQELSPTSPTPAKHTDASSGWQTQKKKKKSRKTVRSENDVSLVNSVGGEMLPLDESLRKGG